MGLFDRFKKQKKEQDNGSSASTPAQESYQHAMTNFDEGDYQTALGSLVGAFRADANYVPAYQLAAKCLKELGATEEAVFFDNAVKNFNQAEPFKNLGVHFYEVGHYEMAIPLLEKAYSMDVADGEVRHDLAIVYTRRFQVDKAFELMKVASDSNDFWDHWFYYKLSILNLQTEGVAEGLEQLQIAVSQAPEGVDTSIPMQKLEEVKEMLARYESIGSPDKTIQHWQFIQYGNIILDYFEDSDDYVAGGRYVAAWGSNQSIKGILYKFKEYSKTLNLKFDRLCYLPEPHSEIVGRALALELAIEVEEYEAGQNHDHSLVVAANSFDFDEYNELSTVSPGQVLFALNHGWMEACSISPDISGLMSQTYSLPWAGGGLRFDPETGTAEQTEADERAPQEIANDIYNEELSENTNLDKLEFYVQRRELLKGIGEKAGNQRHNFMTESPVPGSYFG